MTSSGPSTSPSRTRSSSRSSIVPARDLLERHPRHRTAHAALLATVLDVLGGSPVRARSREPPELHEALTESELRVLRYLPSNLSAPEIAGQIFLSTSTVKTHMRHIYEKLDAHRRTEAVDRARAPGAARTIDAIGSLGRPLTRGRPGGRSHTIRWMRAHPARPRRCAPWTNTLRPTHYVIRVRGVLSDRLLTAFPGLRLAHGAWRHRARGRAARPGGAAWGPRTDRGARARAPRGPSLENLTFTPGAARVTASASTVAAVVDRHGRAASRARAPIPPDRRNRPDRTTTAHPGGGMLASVVRPVSDLRKGSHHGTRLLISMFDTGDQAFEAAKAIDALDDSVIRVQSGVIARRTRSWHRHRWPRRALGGRGASSAVPRPAACSARWSARSPDRPRTATRRQVGAAAAATGGRSAGPLGATVDLDDTGLKADYIDAVSAPTAAGRRCARGGGRGGLDAARREAARRAEGRVRGAARHAAEQQAKAREGMRQQIEARMAELKASFEARKAKPKPVGTPRSRSRPRSGRTVCRATSRWPRFQS